MEYTEKVVKNMLSSMGVANIQLWKVKDRYVLSGHLPGKPLCVGRGDTIQQAYEDFMYEWNKREVVASSTSVPF